jgi:hypothetical protein
MRSRENKSQLVESRLKITAFFFFFSMKMSKSHDFGHLKPTLLCFPLLRFRPVTGERGDGEIARVEVRNTAGAQLRNL